jgi:hypothetical protein
VRSSPKVAVTTFGNRKERIMDLRELTADALLGVELPNSSVAAAVYQHASLKSQHARQKTALPPALALASAKNDGWIAAAMQASSATDPEVLRQLLRDKRIHVREALVANPHLPANLLQELWDIYKDDYHFNAGVAGRIDLDYAMQPRNLPAAPTQVYNIFAQRIIAEARHDLEPAALGLFAGSLLAFAKKSSMDDVARVLAHCDEPTTRELLTTLAADAGTADEDFIDLLISHRVGIAPRAAPGGFLSDGAFDKIMSLDPTSTLATDFYVSMARSALTESQDAALVVRLGEPELSDATRFAVYEAVAEYTRLERERLVLAALDWLRARGYELPVSKVLHYCNTLHAPQWWTPPTNDEIVGLIARGSSDALREWLNGRYVVKVRPGDLSEVLTTPGYSLRNNLYHTLHATAAAPDIAIWARELIEHCPMTLNDLATSGNQGILSAAVEIITERIGDDPRAWSVFFQGLGNNRITLSDALDTTEAALARA